MDSVVELVELNNAQQTALNGNNVFNIQQQQQQQHIQQQQQHQMIPNQPNVSVAQQHIYRQQQQLQQQQQQQQANMRCMPSGANNIQKQIAKHRELPVDVPDSFVGIAKQSPRYPPPKPNRQVSPSMPLNSMTTFNHPPQVATSATNTAYNINNGQANQVTSNSAIPANMNQTTAASLHNSSLRSSVKLKQLKQYPMGQMQPAVNQAFELNEDDVITPPQQQQQQHPNNGSQFDPHHIKLNYHNQQQQSTNNSSASTKQPVPIADITSVYNRLQRNLNGEFADVSGDAKLTKLISIYNTIVKTHNKQFKIPSLTSRYSTNVNAQAIQEPVNYKVSDLLQSVIYMLNEGDITAEAAELLAILCKHQVDGVCLAFDRIVQSFEFAKSSGSPAHNNSSNNEMVSETDLLNQQSQVGHHMSANQPPMYSQANKMGARSNTHMQQPASRDDYEYAPDQQVQMDIENNLYQNSLHPLTDVDLSDGAHTRTVRIEKSLNRPLGATIKNDVDGSVIIGRVVCGGAAHSTGLLHEGDEIIAVNGVQMRGKNINEVVDILEGMNGTLTLTIMSRFNKPIQKQPQDGKIFVRAFFKYDGENDDFIPCKELGLSFEKGEILAITDQTDPKWWQAHREGDSEWRLAGLIPSINFLKQREKDANGEDFSSVYFKQQERKNLVSLLFNCPKGSTPRRRKRPPSVPFGPEELPFYEEVCLYYPIKYRKRPIILVGPKMIGQREIIAKLLQDSSRFASAVSHTSKPMQEHERDGVDFHFVTRAQFEADIKAGKFIECGQYQNQYYGTSLDAMRKVVLSKKICVHLVNTPSIFNFRNGRAGSELKPFFVFVKPDDSHPEKLRNIVASFSQPKSNLEENIKAIMAEVQLIEQHYLPYFDLVITVSDIERAYQELLLEIEKIENEPQWIPMFWHSTPSS